MLDDVYAVDDVDVLCLDCEMDACYTAACYKFGHTGSPHPMCDGCIMYPGVNCGRVVRGENSGSDVIYVKVGMAADFDLPGYFPIYQGPNDGSDATGEGDEAVEPVDRHVP